jgi:hypothetical protein
MKNRAIFLFLLAVFFVVLPGFPLWAAGQASATTPVRTTTKAEDAPELPRWVRDLRRAEIITFGAFPFAFLIAGVGVDAYRSAQHGWDTRYFTTFGGTVGRTTDEHKIAIAAAAGGAILVGLADYIVVRVKRNRAEREAARLAPGDPIIIRTPWPPGEEDAAGDPLESAFPEEAGPSADAVPPVGVPPIGGLGEAP